MSGWKSRIQMAGSRRATAGDHGVGANDRRAPSRPASRLSRRMGAVLAIGLLLLPWWAVAGRPATTIAQAPAATLLTYQGMLTDASGRPINGQIGMTFRMYHQAEGGEPFWTESYTGIGSIVVIDGLFRVLLGSVTPIDAGDLAGDVYLGIAVGDDPEMTPRELLTSVVHAIQASGIAGDLEMDGYNIGSVGSLSVDGDLVTGGSIGAGTLSPEFGKVHIATDAVPLVFRETDQAGPGSLWRLALDGTDVGFDVSETGTDFGSFQTVLALYGDGDVQISQALTVGGDETTFVEGNLQIGDNSWYPEFADMNGNDFAVSGMLEQNGAGGARFYKVGIGVDPGTQPGSLTMGGNIDMNGYSAVNCGALVEANLQTEEELTAGRLDRFEQGDVLCWGSDRLELCAVANDRLVQAVADEMGRPIVLGAEPIKILGPAKRGDFLVASEVAGYATVNSDPVPGSVIAQALEDFEGDRGLIRAMIRKF